MFRIKKEDMIVMFAQIIKKEAMIVMFDLNYSYSKLNLILISIFSFNTKLLIQYK